MQDFEHMPTPPSPRLAVVNVYCDQLFKAFCGYYTFKDSAILSINRAEGILFFGPCIFNDEERINEQNAQINF